MFGETYAEYVNRALAAGIFAPWPLSIGPDGAVASNPLEDDLRRQQDYGDWLDPEAPARDALIADRIAILSRIADLGGVVLSDVMPPGYHIPDRSVDATISQPGAQSGYSEGQRLAYLRRFHTDPLDISLLEYSGFGSYGSRYRQSRYLSLDLPFFPNGNSADWFQFRADVGEAALTRLQTSLAASRVPVWFCLNSPDAPGLYAVVESRDLVLAHADEVMAPNLRRPGPTPAQRARSRSVLIVFDPIRLGSRSSVRRPDNFLPTVADWFDPKNSALQSWDGLVLDLTGEDLAAVATHIGALSPFEETKGATTR